MSVKTPGSEKAPMGFKVRAFIYLVGVHIIAAFFFLIFHLAGAK
ncbi:DUF6126 family protein [Streptomyces sp. NPDC046977]